MLCLVDVPGWAAPFWGETGDVPRGQGSGRSWRSEGRGLCGQVVFYERRLKICKNIS